MERAAARLGVARLAVLAAALPLAACAQYATVPEPTPVVDAYAQAVQQGDADAIYQLMSDESRRAISRDELRRVLKEQRAELGAHAKGLRSKERVINARAEVRYDDGEIVSLDLNDGEFRVTAADALPASARSPEQALAQLRRVLARRSYAGLLRVLSPRTRAAMERDLRSLVEGLTEPGSLQIDVVGDAATVNIPGGHQVKLRREDGVWHVDDFD
jgi:hypothetical protein